MVKGSFLSGTLWVAFQTWCHYIESSPRFSGSHLQRSHVFHKWTELTLAFITEFVFPFDKLNYCHYTVWGGSVQLTSMFTCNPSCLILITLSNKYNKAFLCNLTVVWITLKPEGESLPLCPYSSQGSEEEFWGRGLWGWWMLSNVSKLYALKKAGKCGFIAIYALGIGSDLFAAGLSGLAAVLSSAPRLRTPANAGRPPLRRAPPPGAADWPRSSPCAGRPRPSRRAAL